MLTALTLSNFRGFVSPTRIPLRRLTLLYGPNSGGKSSIINALLFLRQNLDIEAEFRFDGEFVRLGSFERTVYGHDLDRSMEIGWEVSGRPERVRLKLHGKLPDFYTLHILDEEDKTCVDFVCPLRTQGTVAKFGSGRLSLRESRRLESEPYPGVRVDRLGDYEIHRWVDNVANERGFPSEVSETRISASEIEAQSTREIEAQSTRMEGWGYTFLQKDHIALERKDRLVQLRSVLHKHVQAGPPLTVIEPGWIGTDFGIFGNESIPWQVYLGLEALESIFSESDSSLRRVVHVTPLRPLPSLFFEGPPSWAGTKEAQLRLANLVEKLGMGYRLSIERVRDDDLPSAHKVILRDKGETAHSLSEVGFGLSQLLPILGTCVSEKNALICIQQPEEHLHPRLQAEVGEAIAEITKDPELNNQLLVESHSETLILRIMKLIREHRLTPADVAVVYVRNTGDRSEAFELRLDEEGTFLDPWPGGFFEEGFRERFS